MVTEQRIVPDVQLTESVVRLGSLLILPVRPYRLTPRTRSEFFIPLPPLSQSAPWISLEGNPKPASDATSAEPLSYMIAYSTPMDVGGDANQPSQASTSSLDLTPLPSGEGLSSPEGKKLTVVRPLLLHSLARTDRRSLQIERLERLSKYRIHTTAIRLTNEPHRSGGKAEVVQAKYQQAPNEVVAVKKIRFGDNTDKEKTSKASHLTAGFNFPLQR